MHFLLTRKTEMSQTWDEEGAVVPVTRLRVPENSISLIRNEERDGYNAVQVTDGKTKMEVRVDSIEEYKEGQVLGLDQFEVGDKVRVSGKSKGRGFQGVVKRHGFAGVGMASHGQKNRQRHPGSIGATTPQRVLPGKKMAGRMGNERFTIKNLTVVGIDTENREILVKGAVPGARNGLIEIAK